MAVAFASLHQLLNDNDSTQFVEAAKILLKFADNILKNPNEPKYRRIRLGNQTVESKLLPVSGALECLFEMGFQEDGEYLTLHQGSPLSSLQYIRNKLDAELTKLQRTSNGPTSSRTPSNSAPSIPAATTVSQSQPRPINPLQNFSQQQIFQMEQRFFQKIQSNLVHVLMYEDPSIQLKARSIIPVEALKKAAHEKLEAIIKEDNSSARSIDFRDLMLLELLAWFKNSFFKWMDSPNCPQCNGNTRSVGMAQPTQEELKWQGGRVENYKCDRCQIFVRFPRYNHPEKLLETRCGRCGEWANCFTLCCRALGFEARYVLDWTDHVWTEVYSVVQKCWLHCDPCENTCDKPLLYEAGWGKKLSYVLAFSKDEVQDVTWRYSNKHAEVLSRRNECRETWLVIIIHRLWKAKETINSPDRNKEMKDRLLTELVEFMSPKSADGQNLSGRTSGSLAWRLARGETSQASTGAVESYIFKLADEEKKSKLFHLKYSCAKDEYTRVSSGKATEKKFIKYLHKVQNVFRKEEHDWKMVYLARTEGSPAAAVSWKFDFTGMTVDRVEVRASSCTYENGVISWRLCSKDKCVMLNGGDDLKSYDDLEWAEDMTLTAMLSGGKGDVAWQHTQLFRQKMDDTRKLSFRNQSIF
ncbi:hypothetical protein FSP39_011805 [Pinctada imbricata]|uniref:Peptide-N(4)-(N-acetyl-beta-glucosaminyl)asparagine amidase n=1 Tax=Pinctada imbricata TaxID=66713 RepID=A0AA88Y414_PINIB|nr:hypothetical protein FSP39_011805 [Pinctada imbricata]